MAPVSRPTDSPHHVEASDGTSVFGSLPLSVVEVGWHSDHGVRDWVAQVGLRHFLEVNEKSSVTQLTNRTRVDLFLPRCGIAKP